MNVENAKNKDSALLLLTFVLMIIFLDATNSSNCDCKGNFVPAPTFVISVLSPKEAVYNSNILTLNFSVVGSDYHNTVRYKLDGGNFQVVTNINRSFP